jgi:hypothetical protein
MDRAKRATPRIGIFEFAWRNGRGFNRSITLSVIDVISCANAELRAMIVQLQRSEKIWPSRSRAASIAGGYEDFVDADGREFAS